MQRVKTPFAVADKPPYDPAGTPGYFSSGNPLTAQQPTVPGAQWFNMTQEEIVNVILAAGLTLDPEDDTQLAQAIAAMIAAQAVTVGAATTTTAGVVELATGPETIAGTNTELSVTPAGLSARTATDARTGLVELATIAEAIAGSDAERAITAIDLAAAVLSGTGRTASAGGTADALTATIASGLTALTDGMLISVRAVSANATTTPTLNLTLGATATGAKTIVKGALAPLTAGDIAGAGHALLLQYNSTAGKWVLLNPTTSISPVGTIIAVASETAPTGYLECNGAAISRTAYAALFSAIGTIHGQGDGSTTFGLPDYRGRFLRGWDHAAARDPDRASRTAMNTGGQTGDHVGSVQDDQFRSHTHSYPNGTVTYGGTGAAMVNSGSNTTGASGGNETRPINANVMYCIRF